MNRFESRIGIFVVEPDDLKLISQHDVLQAALTDRLQAIWSRKFWGTPRDETFLRRLDFFPSLSESIAVKKWSGGVGLQPYYPGISPGKPKPLEPWSLSDRFLSNDDDFPQLVLQDRDLTTLEKGLENSVHQRLQIRASLTDLRRKPPDTVFKPPMVVFSKGFTKCAFYKGSNGEVRFLDGLRSITGEKRDVDLLRFLSAAISSRLFKYISFHSGSNLGVGRDQIHLYESLALPFPLPDDELASRHALELVRETANILEGLERNIPDRKRLESTIEAMKRCQPLVEQYFSVTDAEKILIEDTITLFQPSVHKRDINADIPSLAFPTRVARQAYADKLCDVLNQRARKQKIKVSAEARVSENLNLVLLTAMFTEKQEAYTEVRGEDALWVALNRISKAARKDDSMFSYLRGFKYFEPDRLHILKPATMRNWCRTAALNDADAIFEHLVTENA